MFVKRLGADMRIHAARKALTRVSILQREYLESGAIYLERADASDGSSTLRIRITQDPSPELSALAGEAVHSARRALDELAAALVVAAGRSSRHTSFPIARSASQFAEQQRRFFRQANPTGRDAVLSVTPWKGADDKLWELHELTEAEGETLAIVVGQLVPSSSVRVPTALQVLQAPATSTRAANPLHDTSILAPRDPSAEQSDPATIAGSDIQLVIADGELVRGQPVVESLDMLITHVESVIDRVISAAENPRPRHIPKTRR